MGRPSIYSDALAAAICERLGQGESLNAICRDEHMPSRKVVHEWVTDDRDGFRDKYVRARKSALIRLLPGTSAAAREGRRGCGETEAPRHGRPAAAVLAAAGCQQSTTGRRCRTSSRGPRRGVGRRERRRQSLIAANGSPRQGARNHS